MSQWTHVCGVVRFDDLRRAGVRPGFEALARERFTIDVNPLPSGSEGPLTIAWTHGQGESDGYSYMSAALIYGDLRDFGLDELSELENWWKRITTELPAGVGVRAGILQVRVEYHEPAFVWQAEV